MTKQEFINQLEDLNKHNYYSNNAIFQLILKLVKGTDENDLDFKEVLKDEMGLEIINLLLDCYNSEDFLKWLSENDYDIFNNYRYCEKVYKSDYENDEDFKENSGCFYGDDIDCLFYNEKTGVYIKSW